MSVALALLFLSACFKDLQQDDDEAASGSDDDGACTPGTEGCPCIDGDRCGEDLVCMAQVCVNVSGSTDGDDEATSPGTDETGAAQCESAEDCDTIEGCGSRDCVCNRARQCVAAWGQTYEICVDLWQEFSSDGFCHTTEGCNVVYEIIYGEDVIHTSPVHYDTTTASWSDKCSTMVLESTNGLLSEQIFVLSFYHLNPMAKVLLTRACADDLNADCLGLPLRALRQGIHYEPTDYDEFREEFYGQRITIEFTALAE